MLNKINSSFKLLANGPPATQGQIATAITHFGSLPEEFIELSREATEIELQHQNGQYIRIWGPRGCVEMNEANEIRKYIPEAIPIGDDGGGHVIFYATANSGQGLYHVGFGNLELDDAVWIATTLNELLTNARGIETF